MSSLSYHDLSYMQDSYYDGSRRANCGNHTDLPRVPYGRKLGLPQREQFQSECWPITQSKEYDGHNPKGREDDDDKSYTDDQGNHVPMWMESGGDRGRYGYLDDMEGYSQQKPRNEDNGKNHSQRRSRNGDWYDFDSLDGHSSLEQQNYVHVERVPRREEFYDSQGLELQGIHRGINQSDKFHSNVNEIDKAGKSALMSKYAVNSFTEFDRTGNSNQSSFIESDDLRERRDFPDDSMSFHDTDDRDVLVRKTSGRHIEGKRENFSYINEAFDAGVESGQYDDPWDRNPNLQSMDLLVEDGKSTLIRRKGIVKEEVPREEEEEPPNRKVRALPSRKSKSKTLRLRKQELQQLDSIDGVAKFYRDQILQESTGSIHGVASWQVKKSKAWTKFKQQLKSILYQLEPWSGALKTVEGNFGTAIMSYFQFLRWLLFLNLYMMLIMTCLTMVPFVVLHNSPPSFKESVTMIPINNSVDNGSLDTRFIEEALQCTYNYSSYRTDIQNKEDVFSKILDFLQGTGWMEDTVLFYGVYYNKTFSLPTTDRRLTYNMGLVYLLATGAVFVVSFLLLVRNSGKGLKQEVLDEGGKMSQYSNKIFSGWDFCICNEKSAKEKHRNLFQEFHSDLENQRLLWKKSSRTTKDKAKLYTKRVVINLLVVFLLGASLTAIGFSFFGALDLQKKSGDYHPIVQFLIQFMPSLVITILNVIMPIVLKKLVILEDYMPSFEIRMTLLRTVMLRLSSLLTMMFALYMIVNNRCDDLGSNITCNDTRTSWELNPDDKYPYTCGNRKWFGELETINGTVQESSRQDQIKCWETYVGQQIYKLVIMDFLVVVIVTFLVEYPRGLIFKKFNGRVKLVDWIGQQEFDLPKAVLDLVYLQTLCWMGVFFSPLIPAICFLKSVILFYVKKGSLMHNCTQPTRANRTSRSNSLFVGMLLISFCMVCISLTFIIGNFSPSQSCGPFRVYSYSHYVFYDSIRDLIITFPTSAENGLYVFGTLKFFIPALLILCFMMYYYSALSTGYTRKANLLREQLIMEGKDKQFLLARVNDIWQHIDSTQG